MSTSSFIKRSTLHLYPANNAKREKGLVRKQAPAFTAPTVLPNGTIATKSLSDYAGQWVILLFYPLDFTFVCPTELLAFSDAYDKFKALGAEVLGVSCDSEYSHLAWANMPRKQGGLGPNFKLPLVADRSMHLAKEYGCLIEGEGHPLRATYIIGPEGTVRSLTINDTPVGRSVDETIRLLEAFQFSDKHGEVCPANFKASERKTGLIPDPVKAKEYFEKTNA
ncbi:natural killer cell enhancing factor [Blastocladiella britannica]|nr:natural killer cell enhancing factor [Blastocladiella britannica]